MENHNGAFKLPLRAKGSDVLEVAIQAHNRTFTVIQSRSASGGL
jgi:hypothetical protein